MGTWFSEHARTRMQQRGIPAAAVEVLLDYGRASHAHNGCELLYLDKAARMRLAKDNRNADKLRRTYAILGSDGTVITVGHRYRRIPRG